MYIILSGMNIISQCSWCCRYHAHVPINHRIGARHVQQCDQHKRASERASVLLLDLHRKSRTDRERAQTLDPHTDFFFSPSCCAPHLPPRRNRIFQSVATHGCTRDTVRGGAVATGVPHPLMDDGCSLCTVGPRRVGRRCLSPPGTASPDAVPRYVAAQIPAQRNL